MKEILHKVSDCHDSPLKYRKGIRKDTGKEIFIPVCCECESVCEVMEKRLSAEKKGHNKKILWKSIFPGIDKL